MRHNYVEDDNFTNDMPFGEFIRKKRRLMGYNQGDFADYIGAYRCTVSKWELGVTSPPIEDARMIAKLLGAKILIVNEGQDEE